MKEIIDYRIDSDGDMTAISIMGGNVAGYDTKNYGFIFTDGKLSAGAYDLTIDNTNYQDLIEKYSSEYGEPFLRKESTGWGGCSIYSDADKNIVCISEFYGIVYIQSESQYLNHFSDILSEYHEIDLASEMKKIGNTDGI